MNAQASVKSCRKWLPAVAVLLLLVLACAARFASLNLNSLWADELFIVEGVSKPVLESFSYFWRDTHPPLFLTLAFVWIRTFGDSEFAVRMLPAILGVVGVLVTFLAYRRLLGFWTAFLERS